MLKSAWTGSPLFIKNAATALALKETFSPLDREERNEKETHIMIQALKPG